MSLHVATILSVALLMQPATEAEPTKLQTELALKFVKQMADGEFEKAVEPFDKAVAKGLPAATLKQIWEKLNVQLGPFQRSSGTRVEAVSKYKIVFVTCEFAKGKLDTKVVFNQANEIAGLFFVPSGTYQPPSYVDASKFDERDVQIGSGLLTLPGTLTIPHGDGPFPVVVLVHGSGPNDRDETIGPNKPFRDLAHGLATLGIAVLRYEKRTKQHQTAMALVAITLTVKQETIDDVAAAVKLLSKQQRIDAKQIFVLGHSLGGYLIPRIDKATDIPTGFISLAGSTRPIEDLFLEQTNYILSLDGKVTDEESEHLKKIKAQVAKIKSPELSEEKQLLLGAWPKYWLDLRGYDPPAESKSLKKPLLILQGERDYQVTMTDFANWKQALQDRPDVKFISYPKLNHLLMPGDAASTPVEYMEPGNVAEVVVNDIANWLKEQ